MNLSLRNRVATSFVIAIGVILVITFTVFHFLNSLNREIEGITEESNRVSLLTDEVRISAVSILKNQRRIVDKDGKPVQAVIDRIMNHSESLTSQLQTLDSLYQAPEIKNKVAQMLSYVDSLKIVFSKATIFGRDTSAMESVGELTDKILDSFSDFQDIQYLRSIERDKKIKRIINETKRKMMITLIIGFLGTIILCLVVPGKIALPFKKIKDAIRELQECNFDVSIYYSQDDEIGEIAREMNKMIHSLKIFEELRSDRISIENRKFDALANLTKKPVLVANAEGKLIYVNNHLYSLLQIQSEDVIGKVMNSTHIPESIIESYELAIRRRSKIENAEIVIPARYAQHAHENHDPYTDGMFSDSSDDTSIASGQEEKKTAPDEILFNGYANIIPIRGKESALDYYLMVLSKEVYT
jgi:nitrogen fixation/metabolism regulation signal transduction histidine kinase